MHDSVESVLQAICKKLSSKFDEGAINDFEKLLKKAYFESIEKHIPDLERIVKQFFSIDSRVLLPANEIHAVHFDSEYEARLGAELEAEKKKYIAMTILEKKLVEISENIFRQDVVNKLTDFQHESQETSENYVRLAQSVGGATDVAQALLESLSLG